MNGIDPKKEGRKEVIDLVGVERLKTRSARPGTKAHGRSREARQIHGASA